MERRGGGERGEEHPPPPPPHSSLPPSLQPLLLRTSRDSSTRTTIPQDPEDEELDYDRRHSPIAGPSASAYGALPPATSTASYHHQDRRREQAMAYPVYQPAPLLAELEPGLRSRPSDYHPYNAPRGVPYYNSEPAQQQTHWREDEPGPSTNQFAQPRWRDPSPPAPRMLQELPNHYEQSRARMPYQPPPPPSRSAYMQPYPDPPQSGYRREPAYSYDPGYSRPSQPSSSSYLPPPPPAERPTGFYGEQPRQYLKEEQQPEYPRLPQSQPQPWQGHSEDDAPTNSDERSPDYDDGDGDGDEDDDYRPSGSSKRKPRRAPGSDQPPRKKSNKVEIACNFCRARKLKCDGARPMCYNCQSRGTDCEYVEQQKRRGKGKDPKRTRGAGRGRTRGRSRPEDQSASSTPYPTSDQGYGGESSRQAPTASPSDVSMQEHSLSPVRGRGQRAGRSADSRSGSSIKREDFSPSRFDEDRAT
ncbi:hypothetical protein CYLTODRAFT_447066 [Cylindrobasidium torrendii FP15055 ss-10]|uniref:Zn(2)-C6 fungal-type domain-containing protein n=1 Tax=Cylindrobasidium torrendii FP15055 ss-10 TaxID=1314674 RepID=A0A0D7AWA7_9AGAR|nr:hypothetical protein CYLTODRAFT_447066 [Cylindrobasidium torrendii FP15055 ss-10]